MSANFDYIARVLKKKGYEIGEKLGKGGFANCWRVVRNIGGFDFACKIIPKQNENHSELGVKATFENELKTLRMTYHPNVIKIYDYFEDEHAFFMILEYCPQGTVYDWQKRFEELKMPKKDIFTFSYELASALEFLHTMNIAHHDIKPTNCLIGKDGALKLSDFGLAQLYSAHQAEIKHGTSAFLAPEIFSGKMVDPFKADIWALGVTFYFFFEGKLPFTSKDKETFIQEQQSFSMSYANTKNPIKICMIKVINHCLRPIPQDRYGLKEILDIFAQYEPYVTARYSIKRTKPISMSPLPNKLHAPISIPVLPSQNRAAMPRVTGIARTKSEVPKFSSDGAIRPYICTSSRAPILNKAYERKSRLSISLLRSGVRISYNDLDAIQK